MNLAKVVMVIFLHSGIFQISNSIPLKLNTDSFSSSTIHYEQVEPEDEDFNPPVAMAAIAQPDNDYYAEDIKAVILKKLFTENNYDPTVRPRGENGTGATIVTVWISLRSVENVDDVRMQYSVQMVFRQEWVDPRLRYEHLIEQNRSVQYFQLVPEIKVWLPDIFFKNEKSGSMHHLIVPNFFTRLYPNGRILQSYRISLVLSCLMNLKSYPLDTQDCPINIESYGWTTQNMVLKWKSEKAVDVASEFSTSRFHSKGFEATHYDKSSGTGNYSCLRLHIKFAREFGFYLIQIYLPCSMLVIVSWVSFWLDPTAVEARVSLGVTTILTIVTQTYGINQSAPPASYAKALDVWTAWCQGMVFGALLEFASVNYLCHKQKLKAKKMFQNQKEKEGVSMSREELQIAETEMLEKGIYHAKRIDRASRIIFPIIFIIYNLFYWSNYLWL